MRKRRSSFHLTSVSPSKSRIIKDRNILLPTSSSTKLALVCVSKLEVLMVCKWGSHRLELLLHQVLLHMFPFRFPMSSVPVWPHFILHLPDFFCIPNASVGPFPVGILQPLPRFFSISCSVSKTQNPKYHYLELFSCHFRKLPKSADIEIIWVVLLFHWRNTRVQLFWTRVGIF